MPSQPKNGRDFVIYTEQMLYLQKLIFNIPFRREVRNITDMKEFNWASVLDNFMHVMPSRQNTWCTFLSLFFIYSLFKADLYITSQ